MKQLIYLVHVDVKKEVAERYREWLLPHISEVLESPGFLRAELDEDLEVEGAKDTTAFRIRYLVRSREELELYFRERAPALREDGLRRFPDQFVARREVWQKTSLVGAAAPLLDPKNQRSPAMSTIQNFLKQLSENKNVQSLMNELHKEFNKVSRDLNRQAKSQYVKALRTMTQAQKQLDREVQKASKVIQAQRTKIEKLLKGKATGKGKTTRKKTTRKATRKSR